LRIGIDGKNVAIEPSGDFAADPMKVGNGRIRLLVTHFHYRQPSPREVVCRMRPLLPYSAPFLRFVFQRP
jgi:hypothetical protein